MEGVVAGGVTVTPSLPPIFKGNNKGTVSHLIFRSPDVIFKDPLSKKISGKKYGILFVV